MDFLNKMLYQLGRTETTEIEDSELLQLPMSVVSKEHKYNDGYPALFAWIYNSENYRVTFKSKRKNRKISLTLDSKKLFDALNEGDEATLAYVIARESSYDFLPPDFENKARTERKFITYLPFRITASKIAGGKYDISRDFRKFVLEQSYGMIHSK